MDGGIATSNTDFGNVFRSGVPSIDVLEFSVNLGKGGRRRREGEGMCARYGTVVLRGVCVLVHLCKLREPEHKRRTNKQQQVYKQQTNNNNRRRHGI